jgi:hypothetical protein
MKVDDQREGSSMLYAQGENMPTLAALAWLVRRGILALSYRQLYTGCDV